MIMIIIIISVALIILGRIQKEIAKLSKDIRDLNRIIKRLQAANGMIADGIDKVGK